MLDSERTFKTKVRLRWTVIRNFAYVSNYLHLKSFAWKQECPISSKLQNVTKSTKIILESSYRVLQVAFK